MAGETTILSDAEAFQLLQETQEIYEQYLSFQDTEAFKPAMPTYSSDNPVGLVIDAVVD